jgi:hypothetical protein
MELRPLMGESNATMVMRRLRSWGWEMSAARLMSPFSTAQPARPQDGQEIDAPRQSGWRVGHVMGGDGRLFVFVGHQAVHAVRASTGRSMQRRSR